MAFIVTDNLATKDSAGHISPALVSLATADVADVRAVVGFAAARLEAQGEDVSDLTGEMW